MEEAQTKTNGPCSSPVIGSHATTACSGLLSAPLHHQGTLQSPLLPTCPLALPSMPPTSLDSTQQRAAPSTTCHLSNDGTATLCCSPSPSWTHRLPRLRLPYPHWTPDGDVFASALGPIPLLVVSASTLHARSTRYVAR
ncbi:hypothetical protein B0T18DRAFT_177279 [Schizothecium vesticola]|uniref:Uncharacterized protein n=1 Tax=Schizothecium vesticola TaxID=314040 RepID=A0AA40EPL1_9PEZI|nr:hypothetical protein B0T18DRAFT_177279 [Schizothecium vesticola]